MSILIGVVSVVALGAAAFFVIPMIARGRQGYKEDREKAEKEFEKKAQEQADGREQNRRNLFTKEFAETLDDVLRNPERYCASTDYMNRHEKNPHLKSLVEMFRNYEQTLRTNRSQAERITELQKSIRELRAEIKEVHRKLEPYA